MRWFSFPIFNHFIIMDNVMVATWCSSVLQRPLRNKLLATECYIYGINDHDIAVADIQYPTNISHNDWAWPY